jgi:superfamily II DNA or RNA helicase
MPEPSRGDSPLTTDDLVRDMRNRSRTGTVSCEPTLRSGRPKVRVDWDDGSSGWITTSLLVTATDDLSLKALLRGRAFGGREDFVRNFTHRKLLSPVDDTLYTLNASRTQILPHQFKPLVKFLDSVHRRYLIADEVGLGKTIEAGIIISELRARQALGGVLIVCPNMLREKWQSELDRRFDEDFKIIGARRDWLSLSAKWLEEGTEGARYIIGRSTIAAKEILEAVEQGAPSFDLIIVDEAHYAKNTATKFRQIIGDLADAADKLLLLTATPLQTKVDDLLSLLRLVDEQAFQQRHLFEDRLLVNRSLVTAETALRRSLLDDTARSAACVDAFVRLEDISGPDERLFGLDEGGRLSLIRSQLSEGSEGTPDYEAMLNLADRLAELNLLSPYITRTRKIDVQSTCQRRVAALRPTLKEAEREFYRLASEWIRNSILERHGPERVVFLSREPERRLASSFHGFWRRLKHGKAQDLLGMPPPELEETFEQIRGTDTKYAKLRKALRELWKTDPEAKVVIFASFRATISHLDRRLRHDGIEHEVIHGGVPMDPAEPDDPVKNERAFRIEKFLSDPKCQVLVSSNVGGEGLDMQRASVVVNYDLPWNPATVEQRIGRIDRFGQEREVIHVINMLLPDTVEDLIFTRLLFRLHLFETTVGDLAHVLGPIVTQLTRDFLSQELTTQQFEDRLRDAETRGLNGIKDRQALIERENEFIAYDQDFVDQLRHMEASARTIRPDEVAAVCTGIVQRHFTKSHLLPAEVLPGHPAEAQLFELYADFELREFLKRCLRERPTTVLSRFLARIPEASPRLVTFDGETAEKVTEVTLLTTRHPFVRELVRFAHEADTLHPVSAVHVNDPTEVSSPGLLALFAARLKFGQEVRRFLIPIFTPLGASPLDETASRKVLRETLDRSVTSAGHSAPSGDELTALFEVARRRAEDAVGSLADRILERETQRIRPRVGEFKTRYDRRIDRQRGRLRDVRLALAFGQSEVDQKELKVLEERETKIEAYRKRLVREQKRGVELLQRLPEVEEIIEPVGAVWIETS